MPPTETLKARFVFPVAGPPIADGAVTIQGDRIVAVGRASPGTPGVDLGNVALLPGLVNAHTHLELSDLDEPLGPPGIELPAWIGRLLAYRRARPAGAGQAVEKGLAECVAAGTAHVADFAQPGWDPAPLAAADVDATVLLELIGPTADRAEACLETARQHLAGTDSRPGVRRGLAPHAPYSVHPLLLERAVALSRERAVPLATHLAESHHEIELLRRRAGPLRRLLEDLGAWNDDLIPSGVRPLDYLRKLAGAERALVVHGAYLDDTELAFVAAQAEQMSVVYCPRTHAHFGHAAYPLERMAALGVNVALGTDSRATSPDLSLLAEMRRAAARHPAVAPAVIVRMATFGGARALGLADRGRLVAGARADLTAVALPPDDAADPHELLLGGAGPVVGRCRAGRWEAMPGSK